MGDAMGALRYQPSGGGGGNSLSGTAAAAGQALTYGASGGFGGEAGLPQSLNLGWPIGIAAISPFVALLGKVIKDRAENE